MYIIFTRRICQGFLCARRKCMETKSSSFNGDRLSSQVEFSRWKTSRRLFNHVARVSRGYIMLVFGYALFFLPLFSFGLNGFVVGNYVTAASLTTESVICSESSACVDNGSIILEEFKRQYPVHLWKMYGLFTDEYLKRINTHWLKFPPPYPATHYSLAVLYAVIMLFGLTGNALVIFMFIR